MLRRKRFDVLRKRPVKFTQKATEHTSTDRKQILFDNVQVSEKVTPTIEVLPQDFIDLGDAISTEVELFPLDLISVYDAVLYEESAESEGSVSSIASDAISVSDFVSFVLDAERFVADTIDVTDAVDYTIERFITETASDVVSVFDDVTYAIETTSDVVENVVDGVSVEDSVDYFIEQELVQTVTDEISVSDSVTYSAEVTEVIAIPDYYLVYNHNYNSVSANLNVWWDNDTSTSYTLYYSPPEPSNPHIAELYYEYLTTVSKFKIYFNTYTGGKTLNIVAYDVIDYPLFTTQVTPQAGWVEVVPPNKLEGVYYIVVYPDTSVLGAIEVAEFQVIP